ncbi:unnamed protein product [Closterium sp. NIES-64]|nr:unnamed protein product [Closterium sp. NIES-64]
MLLKRVWASSLSAGASSSVKFQELLPSYVAKTKFCRLQLSFLLESDALGVREKQVVYHKSFGTEFKIFWQHTEDAGYAKEKSLNPHAIEIPSSSHLLIIGDLNLVEDPALDKTSGCGSSSENEKFFLRCCSFQLSDAFRVLHPRKREYTFYSAAQQESSRIDRALVSQSLLPHLSLASHEMPKEPIADHGFAIHVAFRLDAKARTGPGIWRLHASMLRRPGVRKVIEVTLRHTPVNDGSSFELLLSRLSVGLWSYAREEGKCVKATLAHLHRAVAVLKQELMGDPGCGRKKALLAEKEQQLKAYHAARRDKLHLQAGLTAELTGEIASKHLSAKVRARKARTQIAELKVGGTTVGGGG